MKRALTLTLLVAPLLPTPVVHAAEMPEHLAAQWDEEVGLWRGSTKHGRDGHDIRASATKLVHVACLGLLDEVPSDRILANLRRAQAKKGNLRGNFWWAWEDRKVTDRNSGFFTTIQLLALHYEFRDQLAEAGRADLDHMLREAEHWFAHKVVGAGERHLRYPNAFMGDAICLWLLREIGGRVDDPWRKEFRRILAYYRDEDWGWGEHLSDLYVKICQRELAALLMWGEELDDATRNLAVDLLGELRAIDAAFAGGPRVPTIRCYWFDRSPRCPEKWPHWFRPWTALLDPETPIGEFTVEHLAARRGLFVEDEIPAPDGPAREVPCHCDAVAHAWVSERWRYGVLGDYPFFPDTNDHRGYGLHWQSMPMAYWHVAGDWAYLQWWTVEDDVGRGLPAASRKDRPSCRLSDRDGKARYGVTRGVRVGDALLVHRELPGVSGHWSSLADRWRHVHPTGDFARDRIGGWERMTVTYGPDEVLTVACRVLEGGGEVVLEEVDGERRFGIVDDFSEARPARFRSLWFVRMASAASEPPAIEGGEGDGLRVEFDGRTATYRGRGRWRVDAP